jgi:hypothetical protein
MPYLALRRRGDAVVTIEPDAVAEQLRAGGDPAVILSQELDDVA